MIVVVCLVVVYNFMKTCWYWVRGCSIPDNLYLIFSYIKTCWYWVRGWSIPDNLSDMYLYQNVLGIESGDVRSPKIYVSILSMEILNPQKICLNMISTF